jgi:hypothetical protein
MTSAKTGFAGILENRSPSAGMMNTAAIVRDRIRVATDARGGAESIVFAFGDME